MSEKEEQKQQLTIDDFPGKLITLPDGSTTKNVYIVKVEDPSMRTKISTFATAKIDIFGYGVDFAGYLVSNKSSDEIKTIQEAIIEVNKGNKELYSITYPWHKVTSVRNVSYRNKK